MCFRIHKLEQATKDIKIYKVVNVVKHKKAKTTYVSNYDDKTPYVVGKVTAATLTNEAFHDYYANLKPANGGKGIDASHGIYCYLFTATAVAEEKRELLDYDDDGESAIVEGIIPKGTWYVVSADPQPVYAAALIKVTKVHEVTPFTTTITIPSIKLKMRGATKPTKADIKNIIDTVLEETYSAAANGDFSVGNFRVDTE